MIYPQIREEVPKVSIRGKFRIVTIPNQGLFLGQMSKVNEQNHVCVVTVPGSMLYRRGPAAQVETQNRDRVPSETRDQNGTGPKRRLNIIKVIEQNN
jgi:hypothetical protein